MAEVITAASEVAAGLRWAFSRTFPARADQVHQARAFLRPALANCPAADDVLLVCSELAANAVQHSASAQPGGQFTVRAEIRAGESVWIAVEDNGGGWVARTQTGERGRGLLIVDELAACWDVQGDETGRVVCARLDWPDPASGRSEPSTAGVTKVPDPSGPGITGVPQPRPSGGSTQGSHMNNDQARAHQEDEHSMAPAKPRRAPGSPTARAKAPADQPRSRRWHRGPKGATMIDLIFKIASSDGWSATLRNDPSVVLVAETGDELAQLTRELALALLQNRRAETLRSMRLAGTMLPAADSETGNPGAAEGAPQPRDRDAADGRPVNEAS
jgi:serine/threonine-protein kinase RsbW